MDVAIEMSRFAGGVVSSKLLVRFGSFTNTSSLVLSMNGYTTKRFLRMN